LQALFLNRPIYVEEKVDGANMGISIVDYKVVFQNRSHYINSKYHEQFRSLDTWTHAHRDDVFAILEPDRHILYGEWLYAKHSIPYERLPGLFVAFDIYDQFECRFWSRERVSAALEGTSIPLVPLMAHRTFKTAGELAALTQQQSRFYDGRVEGVYLRICDDDYLTQRGKIVRTDFLAGNKHWSARKVERNGVAHAGMQQH
jgi:atypical dual specificity phosphatase